MVNLSVAFSGGWVVYLSVAFRGGIFVSGV